MDDTHYFWKGRLTRLRPVSADDAERSWRDRLDSPGRQVLQLGIELPTTVEDLRESLAPFDALMRICSGVWYSHLRTGRISSHSRPSSVRG